RPALRTFTPRRLDTDALELDLEIGIHGSGVASEWAETAEAGDRAAVSGPGRGYAIDRDAPAFLLGGDEAAIPAISQLLETLPVDRPVQVHIEISRADARIPLPRHPAAVVSWHQLGDSAPPGDDLLAAVRSVDLIPDTRVWVAGEAAAVQRIRKHLLEERRLPRSQTTVRGYWKHGRTGGGADD
ncbi:MAG: siderophore-interacting protein, partial [Actinomycetota bacterium]|nr:siderophore-interacting protein [Actinomycetota bacterium]